MCDCSGDNRKPAARRSSSEATQRLLAPRRPAQSAEAARKQRLARARQEAAQLTRNAAALIPELTRLKQELIVTVIAMGAELNMPDEEYEPLAKKEQELEASIAKKERAWATALATARAKLRGVPQGVEESVESAMKTLGTGYGTDVAAFEKYIQGTAPLPLKVNCWEAIVASAIESGQLSREDIPDLDLDQTSDDINEILGIDDAEEIDQPTDAARGQVAFLFHTAHVILCQGNDQWLSWWGGGTRVKTLQETFQLMDQNSADFKRDAIACLFNHSQDAEDTLLAFFKQQYSESPQNFPASSYFHSDGFPSSSEHAEEALREFKDRPNEFGFGINDMWRLFLPSTDRPLHGALKVGTPSYLGGS